MKIDDVKELLPLSDGSTRRRLLAGLILVAGLLPMVWHGDLKSLVEQSGLGNATLAIGFLLFVYALGVLIEIFSESVLIRMVGAMVWAAELPQRSVHARTTPARWILRGLCYYLIVPFYAPARAIYCLFTPFVYRCDLSARFNDAATLERFAALPGYVRNGLEHPYHDRFGGAWAYLTEQIDSPTKDFVVRLFNRNRELLSLTSAVLVVTVLYAFRIPEFIRAAVSEEQLPKQVGAAAIGVGTAQIVVLAIVVLLSIYHRFLLASIVNAVELLALSVQSRRESASSLTEAPGGRSP
jgi:hypothetical protein